MVDNMEGVRAPFDQAAMQQSDIKERFYRYFQQEVTGKSYFLTLSNNDLTNSRASGADKSAGESFSSRRRKTRCYRSLPSGYI